MTMGVKEDIDWEVTLSFPDGQKGVFKWSLHPGTQTQFPAAALLYRQGYVRRGPAVVHEERPLDDLWDRKPPG